LQFTALEIQVNEVIYKQPLVLFLGAGASAPLGMRTTLGFWEWLKSKPELGDMYSAFLAVGHYIQPSKAVGKTDVEAALDFLEDLVRAGKLFLKVGGDDVLTRMFTRGATDIVKLDEYERICNQIKNLVIEHYSEIDEKKAFEHCYLLLELAIRQPLPIFTTNYDLSIEKAYEFTTTPSYELGKAPFNLIDGFSRKRRVTPRWARAAYDDYEPTGADVIFFKLHGSVDWVRTPSGAIQRFESRIRDPGGVKTEIVYPSQLKREIHEEPYRTNYDYLLACLLHAKVCAVIGFSFRDQEIVEEFRQTMELNEQLELMIIDPNAETIRSQLESKLGFGPKAELIEEEYILGNMSSIAEKIAAKIK
jgi:uncharacterized protein YutE (UPF0331/DUF86 family)